MKDTLKDLGVPDEVLDMPPDHPAMPDVPLLPKIPPLRATAPNDQIPSLTAVTREFVVNRLGSETVIQLIPIDTPRIHIARRDFVSNLEEIARRAVTLSISAPAATSALDIRRRRACTWIEGR